MATTATLNGGPTGGLHTTTNSLIHSENNNPPQEETCRVESNSSFESGNDEQISNNVLPASNYLHRGIQEDQGDGAWSNCEGLDRSFDASDPNAMDYRGGMDAKGKKRRKQSRPVRIPANELPLLGTGAPREHGSLLSESAGTGSEGDEAGELSAEREMFTEAKSSSHHNSSRVKHKKRSEYVEENEEMEDDEEEGLLRRHPQQHRRQQLPLNLTGSGKYEGEEDDEEENVGNVPGLQQRQSLAGQATSALSSVLTGGIETDKTEAVGGQGTKNPSSSSSPHLPLSTSRVLSSTSPNSMANINRQQFSPPLFSLTGSGSPFSSIFPSGSGGNPVSNYFQGSSHQQNNVLGGVGGGHPPSISGGAHPPGTPNSTSSTGSNQNGQGGGSGSLGGMPPHRIFNPEAYCDLCNKEFCNKYFLKTHKANKHGVYTEMPPSVSSSSTSAAITASMTSNQILAAAISSSPSSSSFLNITHGAAAVAAAAAAASAHSFSPCLPSTPLMSTAPVNPGPGSSSASTGALQVGKPCASESAFTSAFQLGGGMSCLSSGEIGKNGNGSNNSTGSSGSLSATQRESYCELCQKEFCNKYFLKRHKAKIHGIPIPAEPSAPSSLKGSPLSGKSGRSAFSNGMGDGKRLSEEALAGIPSLREMGLDNLGLDLVTKHLEEGSGGNTGDREDLDNAHSDESNAPANSLNSFQSEMNTGDGNNTRGRTSPDNGGDSSFKMSSLDLKPGQNIGSNSSNAENTCQFCYREFPTQQLLRSHIIKKHRLLLQSAFPPFLLQFPQIPLEDSEPGGLDSNGNNTEVDYECNICNRTFQTIYLLRMHKSYFHPEADQDSGDPLGTKIISEASSLFANERGGEGEGKSNEKEKENENEGDTDQGFDSDADVEAKYDSSKAAAIEMENRGEATSDSDDLRRLQTMIMELNRVSTASSAWSPPLAGVSTSPTTSQYAAVAAAAASGQACSSLVCPICSKEFYSSFFLQQHIQHYHSTAAGALASEASSIRKSESPLGEPLNSNLKKGSEPGNGSLQKDRLEGALTDPTTGLPTPPGFLTPGPKGGGPGGSPLSKSEPSPGGGSLGGGVKRPSPSLSRSYCTICHKELCNKYFMRTHMLKMHGISIESSTGLGGVTCDICNKELCSKYFLKVHKQNTHGIIEDGPSPPNPSTPGPTPPSLTNFPIINPPIMNLTSTTADTGSFIGQPELSPTSLLSKDQGERYLNHFSEVCPLCGRRFRSPKWLKSHLHADHGQDGREKWKVIEKSLGLHRRSPKIKSNNNNNNNNNNGSSSSLKSTGNGSSSGKNNCQSSGGKVSSKDNKCALCGFTSNDQEVLHAHILKEHGGQLGSTSLKDVGMPTSPFPEGSSGLVLDPLTMLFQKMEGGTNKLYRCSYCPFTTSLLVYLYAHERTHTGLANSVTGQNPLGTSPGTPDAKCPFQCPMCFHTFQQPDAFQQHLIGHQMSGVLAPFFTPSAAASSSGQYPFLGSGSADNETDGVPEGLFAGLPLLNGGSGSSLYMALNANKNMQEEEEDEEEEEEEGEGKKNEEDEEAASQQQSRNNPAADLTTKRKINEERDENHEMEASPRKTLKISRYCCTCCHARFKSRKTCISHIRQEHKGKRVVFKAISVKNKSEAGVDSRGTEAESATPHSFYRGKRLFRCRKCRFTSTTYTSLMVHSKLQHSILRPGFLSNQGAGDKDETGKQGRVNLPEGRGLPHDGASEDFIMQGFLLHSSEEESSSSSGYFVPSLVYLPVREKVSQSIRVSFSLTPTS